MFKNTATYLLAAQFGALGFGYILRSPDLQATAERQTNIRNEQKESAFDRQEAIQRAQICIALMSEMPITDGLTAYFSSIKAGRLSSTRTVQCLAEQSSVMLSGTQELSL